MSRRIIVIGHVGIELDVEGTPEGVDTFTEQSIQHAVDELRRYLNGIARTMGGAIRLNSTTAIDQSLSALDDPV